MTWNYKMSLMNVLIFRELKGRIIKDIDTDWIFHQYEGGAMGIDGHKVSGR